MLTPNLSRVEEWDWVCPECNHWNRTIKPNSTLECQDCNSQWNSFTTSDDDCSISTPEKDLNEIKKLLIIEFQKYGIEPPYKDVTVKGVIYAPNYLFGYSNLVISAPSVMDMTVSELDNKIYETVLLLKKLINASWME